MKQGWRTRAIGRHLVDIPGNAKTIETYALNKVKIQPLPDIHSKEEYEGFIAQKEISLRAVKHRRFGGLFLERVQHSNGAVTFISWDNSDVDEKYKFLVFDTYFCADNRFLAYSGEVSPEHQSAVLANLEKLSGKWRQISDGEIPEGIGFVVDDAILADKRFNPESWRMVIQFHGKPDVFFELTSYVQYRVGPGLRERAGGILAGLLGVVAGFARLRDRARPVGPIQADEILLASTTDGKRGYGFKWEAPGKEESLAEPNLNASLRVGESAYASNRESFATDEEALELWDAVIDSIRLRPGAV
ncbi:T6SS immunity protein Tli4 family protein [Cupriavidus sp. SZY C1]|uniref:T6SS immunity protein Tli4 family protein n=1 Tax=Cupriavidus sp. SZY C1 TaxID=3055037 RepID=UPI0028B6AE7A|nr:T6SS immunity protein Tli4 family protein [Cupriavidus sp. SZY C1]MDT6960113.1 T6SS immunity protein Tli4 family protein [Cupriavidus sp. SZY C1]